MELASSDAAAILFFLEEEIEKNGGANRADSVAHPYQGSQKIHGIATPVCALARNDASVWAWPPDNPSVGFADTSLYTREAIRCGGEGPMSTRKGQAASVTLLRREQLRPASAPTFAAAGAGE